MITTAGKEINELVNAYCRLHDRPFNAPPVIVNYFYHSPIKKSAKKRPQPYFAAAGAVTAHAIITRKPCK